MEKYLSHFFCRLAICLPLLVALTLSGCGHSEISTEENKPVNPNGIWLGAQTVFEKDSDSNVQSNVFDMKTIIYEGRFYGISEEANLLFHGTYEMGSGGRMIVDGSDAGKQSYKMYSLSENGQSWVDGIAVLNIVDKDIFSGRFQNNALQEGTLKSYYSSLYEKEASINYLAGSYSADSLSITIDSEGHINGSKNGCNLTGTVSAPDENANIYEVDYSLEGETCANKTGHYTGLGIVALDENNGNEAYFLGMASNVDETRMDCIYLSLNERPFPLTLDLVDNLVSDYAGFSDGEKISDALMEFAAPHNWPSLVSDAHALSSNLDLYPPKKIVVNDSETAVQNIDDMSGVINNSVKKLVGSDVYLQDGDFTDANFNALIFYNPDGEYSAIRQANFDGSDMENVNFSTDLPIIFSYFENTNLEGSNISDLTASVWNSNSADTYNNFSGAWWEDGRRCGLDVGEIPSGMCEENTHESGLTYQEWKENRQNVNEIFQNMSSQNEVNARRGIGFAIDTGNTIQSMSSTF